MDLESKKQATIKFLKTLPIWEYLEEFNVEAILLKLRVDKHMEKIKEDCNTINALPKLTTTGRLNILSENWITNDSDIVRLYKKNELGQYVLNLTQTKDEDPVIQDPTTNCSIKLLEQKIQEAEEIFAQIKEGEPWVRCKVRYVCHKPIENSSRPTTAFRLKVIGTNKTVEVGKYDVARTQNHGDKLRVPKRVVAGPDEGQLNPGIIGQEPCQSNKLRYMILFDNGSAKYHSADQVWPICYQSTIPWQDLRYIGSRNPDYEAELSHFFKQYPRRHIMQVSKGKKIELARRGIVVPALVIELDCDVMTVAYKDRSQESIYRGSSRLLKRADFISKLLADQISFEKLYFKIPGNIKRYHEAGVMAIGESYLKFMEEFSSKLSICGRSARKSTSMKAIEPKKVIVKYAKTAIIDDRCTISSLNNMIRESSFQSHNCGPGCLDINGIKTELYVQDIVDEFRNVSDLKVPLILGWKRLLVRSKKRKEMIIYVYQAPCGKIFQRIFDIRRYISITGSKLDIDYFTLDRDVNLNRDAVDHDAYLFEENLAIDKKTGKPLENKFVALMNQFDEERLPIDYEYCNETFPHPMLKEKNFSFNPEFKSGCECRDECYQRSSCVCHQLNEQAFGTNSHNKGSVSTKCQYKEKRLLQQVSTGIFECNAFCRCSSKCPNRVVQNGLRFRLQVRKTPQKGWGVVTLDDIPAGAFISTYSAELLDDADEYGDCDMYYADLDYISVVEQQKLALSDNDNRSDEGYDDDQDDDADCDKIKSKKRRIPEMQSSDTSDDGEISWSSELSDLEDFMPNNDRPRRKTNGIDKQQNGKKEWTQFRKIHSLLNESHDYTLDARMQGNIGRFYNHSCDPNAFVQNVFIDTHDLRFPVVAFFAKRSIAATEEISWNYNYKMGSIEGREIKCNCGASNCQGRIL